MAFIPIYILILLFTILTDYFAGIFIENSEGKKKKLFLIFSLIANIGVLAFFKYYNFFSENLSFVMLGMGMEKTIPYLKIILPIGLSFHTFQAMSYTIEVYRGNQKAERNIGIYSLYVMFYPQLVAGPIERPQNLIHQFREKHDFDYERVTSGLRRMAWGLFKKVIIADRLAKVVDPVYANSHQYNSLSLAIATFFFAFQLYCDFSGYTDMAIGAARVMGFKLMENFNMPYQSRSIAQFWSRWHISLSSWLRDYLFLPVAYKVLRVIKKPTLKLKPELWSYFAATIITMFIAGFWHGAGWTFVIFGLLHGMYLVFSRQTQNIRRRVREKFHLKKDSVLSLIITFSLVSLAWIFFRANNVNDAFYISSHIISGLPELFSRIFNNLPVLEDFGVKKRELLISFLLIAVLETVQVLQKKYDVIKMFKNLPLLLRWVFYYAFIFVIIAFGVFEKRQFIYFQF